MSESKASESDRKEAIVDGAALEKEGSASVNGEWIEGHMVARTRSNFNVSVSNAVGVVESGYSNNDDYAVQQAQPTPTGIPHNLPRSNTQFVGRETELETLHGQLQRNQHHRITAIAGMDGIGKTELALRYALNHLERATYPAGICWLRVQETNVGTASVGPEIVDFARVCFGLTPPDGLALSAQVRFCWQHWPAGEVLVVFDDVVAYKQVQPFLPPRERRFKLLFTTPQHFLMVQELQLDGLGETEAIQLLTQRVGEQRIQNQLDAAKALCGGLAYLPLGLELVGCYLEDKADLSLIAIQQHLERKGLEAQALVQLDVGVNRELYLATVFELSWQGLSQSAQQLGCLLSLFALAPISWSLVTSVAQESFPTATHLPDLTLEALKHVRDDVLLKFHLLQRTGEDTYQLHQTIREFFRTKQAHAEGREVLNQGYCRAMVQVAKTIPQKLRPHQIAAIARAIPHLAEVGTTLQDRLSNEDLAMLFVGIAWYWYDQGAYAQAEFWCEHCLKGIQARFGEDHPATTKSVLWLGILYQAQGRYGDAESFYQKALTLMQQLGESHPIIANVLNNLASLYQVQGRYGDAEPLHQTALVLKQQRCGEEHPAVATFLNNLAELYKVQRRYGDAKPLFEKALALKQQLFGEHHPAVATSLNNLAAFYRAQGRYGDAKPLFEKALALRQQLFGEHHPAVATSLNNLAGLHYAQGHYGDAKPLFEKALALRQRLFGEHHLDVATSLNNLAELYRTQKRYGDARSLLEQSLVLRQQLLGKKHPDVATSLNNLAGLYYAQGRYREAELFYCQALQILEQRLGKGHPNTTTVCNNLKFLRARKPQQP